MQDFSSVNRPPSMSALMRRFGKHVDSLIDRIRPDFIVPLETKGAILLQLALPSIENLRATCSIIYPAAFDCIPLDKLRRSRFLVIDDAVFSGRTLKQVLHALETKGVPTSGVHLTAFFDFTAGHDDVDYHADIKQRLIPFDAAKSLTISRGEALRFIHTQILTERMPSTYDHLLFEARGVCPWQLTKLLSAAADCNRLLDYGRRGAFLTSSILLDDLFPGAWDFAPKLRVWYHADHLILRIAPIASPADAEMSYAARPNDTELKLQEMFKSIISNDSALASYTARTFNAKLGLLPYLRSCLAKADITARLDDTHVRRYYPGNSDALLSIARSVTELQELPHREATSPDVLPFLAAARELLTLLKAAYEEQDGEARHRKDFKNQGYTGTELMKRLRKYTTDQVHAAIDYCFDMNYAAAFIRRGQCLARALRSTEIEGEYHHAEVYASTIIYSQPDPTPAWLLSKVFPIVSNSGGAQFDGFLVVKKGPFGDYTMVVWSEESELYWRDIPTDLWASAGSTEEKDLVFRRKADKESEVQEIARDPRVAACRTPLEAALFLCKEGGRGGAVLLNILTGRYGGTDYIAHNLERILQYTVQNNKTNREWHCTGVQNS